MGKISKSFRIEGEVNNHLKIMASLLKETETTVVEKAIERLYRDREAVLEEDIADRRQRASS